MDGLVRVLRAASRGTDRPKSEQFFIREAADRLERLAKALEPFARVYKIVEPLDLPDDKPMCEFVPAIWPTLKACREAQAALAKEPKL